MDGDNGRDDRGRFVRGNPGGPGNPHARQVARFRAALLEAVTDDDLRAIARKLVEESKAGNVSAAGLLLDRLLGKVEAADFADRMESLERALGLTQ